MEASVSAPDVKRLLAAFTHQSVGRTPNFEIVIDGVNASHILGRPVPGLWDMEPADALELARKIGQDAIPCQIKRVQTPEGSIVTHADMDALRITGIEESVKKLEACLRVTRGSGVGVCPVLAGPLTAAYMAAGPVPIQSFMMMIYDDPALAGRLLDFFTEYTVALIEAIKEFDFDFYYIGDDVTGLFSREHLEELWVPREEKIIRTAREATPGRPILCHCCGPLEPVLPYLKNWSIEAVHPIQADVNDIYRISSEYPELCLVGNIDVSRLLSFGTREEVVADTRTHLARLAGRPGGYVACSSHSIIDSVKPENFAAMLETVREH